ncbi:ribosome biogenesis GTP-binding protein YihA/YsxC [Candidatus Endowatersipora endosymbiont of Watersipora subatra]|uniref:ribosome biogenesis GTP-binding protein YihA/YsxC n=1 Tax=Candidatus Endowatersipora endosymbiont of Watersipora subatra TaxID=3077946 RepID=UPI00312CA4DB
MNLRNTEERLCAEVKGKARKLFARKWSFVQGISSINFLPPEGTAEVAFAGRSNVGKSSLINALMSSKSLARTSKIPGQTQELNYFSQEGNSLLLVDMPGYGFTRVPKDVSDRWTALIFNYLRDRSSLKRIFVLIDSRHGLKKTDEKILNLMDKAAISYQLVLTKSDKIRPQLLPEIIDQTMNQIKKRPAAFPELIRTSSQKKIGINELRAAICYSAQLLEEF